MGKLRIVGLGPTDAGGLTSQALCAINDDSENVLRTDRHDAVRYFRDHAIPYTSYDHLYETMDDFDSIYRYIADDLIERAETCNISYFVPGHPLVAERSVRYLLEADPAIEIIDGLSFIEPILDAVKKDPVDGLVFLNGDDFTDLEIDLHSDMLVTQVYNKRVASDLKLALAELYGDEHMVYVLHHAGHPEKEAVTLRPLYELDRFDDYGFETSLYVPKSDRKRSLRDMVALAREIKKCPDAVETHESMTAHLVEKANEVHRALSEGDDACLEEALGEVLFQVLFLSELAGEEGFFTLQDVIETFLDSYKKSMA